MRPLRLILSNFQSHRSTEVDFSQINCAVLSGPNGAGKSSIIDAIRFALFGYARGGNLDTVVTEGEAVCRVEFEFLLGEDHYLVSRQRSRKGGGSTTLSFQHFDESRDEYGTPGGWQVLDGKTASETQTKIIALLHMTDELFTQTACANQGNAAAFSRAKPADRKQVLGDILDLGQWERRAEMARAMTRDLEATRGAKATALEAAEAKAATASATEGLLGGLVTTIAGYQGLLAEQDQALAKRATEREALIGARATDEANRRALVEAQQRQDDATEATQGARSRLEAVTTAVARRQAVVDALGAAETYAAEAADLDAKRQSRDRIASEGKELDAQIKAAKAEHKGAVEKLDAEVSRIEKQHQHVIELARTGLALAQKQAAVLDTVPCQEPPIDEINDQGEAEEVSVRQVYYREHCPLIAQAREARDSLSPLRAKITELESLKPWADAYDRWQALLKQTPAADLITKRDKLAEDYKAIAYDPQAHAQATKCAASRDEYQADLAEIDAQAKLLPDARTAFDNAQANLTALITHVSELIRQLGVPRNWPAELGAIDKRIADAKAEQARLRSEIEAAQQRQGVLSEQLRQAQEAADQVETLRSEIAEIDRRVTLLKILGNPRDGAFSKSGVPALLLDREIPAVEEEANKVLSLISDGAFSVELHTQKERAAGGLAETLDIIVQTEQGPRAYEQLSGGEQMRIDLALRIGLSSLLAQRAGARVEMFVCDEMAAPLDVRGREAFVESMARLSSSGMFGTVLAISHCDDIIESFPTQIRVSRGAEGSRVEVIQ